MNETQTQSLVEAAKAVRSNAYAPFSVYRVGAAALGAGGGVFPGCNVENVSFGLTICAERNAVARMVAEGDKRLTGLALATEDGAPPCGACLQVIAEFASDDLPILLIDGQGRIEETSLGALFPRGFSTKDLERDEKRNE
jgi:cytidine deaminase